MSERSGEREEESGLQKLIQQINHASCLAILYEDIQGTQDAKRARARSGEVNGLPRIRISG